MGKQPEPVAEPDFRSDFQGLRAIRCYALDLSVLFVRVRSTAKAIEVEMNSIDEADDSGHQDAHSDSVFSRVCRLEEELMMRVPPPRYRPAIYQVAR